MYTNVLLYKRTVKYMQIQVYNIVKWIRLIYNDNSIVAKDISIDAEGQSFGINGSGMDKIENLEFDGTTLKYWYLSCNDRETETALKLGLTFDGTDYKINVLDKMSGITGGGSAACYDAENNRYGG